MRPPSLGVVVVASPARCHPSTELVDSVFDSLQLIEGLDSAPTAVICDGYRISTQLEASHAERLAKRLEIDPMRFSKRGIVTHGVSAAYDEFKQRLRAERSGLALLELGSHHGFALAVREGLRWAQDAGCTHALVCQHDRRFVRQLSASTLSALLDHFETRPSCRYVGFPSGTSKRLAARTTNEYKLGALLEARSHALPPLPHGGRLSIRPSIFWYDSNHFVHVDRALELLYTPDAVASAEAPRSAGFDRAPPALRARLGDRGAARFRLRRGDFIEERFGVEQRNLLAGMADDALDAQLEAFDHFGSYLLEEVVEGDEGVLVDREGLVTWVDHIDGRGAVPPSERRQGAAREEKREGRAPQGRWGASM